MDHHTLCHYKSNQMKLRKDEVGKREREREELEKSQREQKENVGSISDTSQVMSNFIVILKKSFKSHFLTRPGSNRY